MIRCLGGSESPAFTVTAATAAPRAPGGCACTSCLARTGREAWSTRFYLRANRRRRREFVTTRTELAAMAAPAIIGLSSPRAATGTPTTL